MSTTRFGRWLGTGLPLALLCLAQTSCLVLPVKTAPGVQGVVLDRVSGQPVANAVVVIRFDAYYDDVLPDRDLLGHREARTDAAGRFEIGRVVSGGISAWPLLKTEARVVGVLGDGYRCARPQKVRRGGVTRILLVPALDETDRRDSCHPVPARPGEAVEYMTAWRELFPEQPGRREAEEDRQLARVLEARTVLGYGANCDGPVRDLALAPGGRRLAYLTQQGDGTAAVHVVRIERGVSRAPRLVARPEAGLGVGRLAWSGPDELVLWEPAGQIRHAASGSILATERLEVVWSAAQSGASPAAPEPGAAGERPTQPLTPADFNDEGDALWLGRSFAVRPALDPETGLPGSSLRVVEEDGRQREFDLPGEVCGPHGRFGRPHYRIAADARTAVDLRFVDGGCHAVAIDLRTGNWARLDTERGRASCRDERTVPASHLTRAVRGWTRESERALRSAGADTAAAYVLEIAPEGAVSARTRDFAGDPVSVRLADFPVHTPLRRIDVSTVGSAAPGKGMGPRAIPSTAPEPL